MAPDFLTLIRSFGMLLLVLALLVLVLGVIRKYLTGYGTIGKPGMIRTHASMPLGPKERIALVEVLGERFLIGITSRQISFLTRIAADIPPEDSFTSREAGFKSLLKRTMGGFPGESKGKTP